MDMMVPLPASVRNLASQITHPGLFLDKYVQSWDAQADTGKLSERVQKPAVEKVVQLAQQPPDGLKFEGLLARWEKSLQSRRVVRFKAKTVGPLTLHLARASALENAGICMHPIYGFVYMPGSGLKGMARAFAETVWLPTQSDAKKAWSQIEDVFGWAPTKDRQDQIQNPNHPAQKRYEVPEDSDSPEIASSSGSIIFYDAWPTDWPKLGVDIVNNHHSHYYSGKTSKLDEQGLCAECQFPPDDPNAHPPGEWEAPVPVYFLAVPAGQSFQFAVGKRRDDVPEHLLELAVQWLIGALEYQGAGAKTAAGYGAFQITQGPERLQPADQPAGQTAAGQIDGQKVQQDVAAAWQKAKAKKVRAEFRCTLELVTPAFLAGAKQNASDCELRPATLRGLLRWWWRTMHAGHVDARTLAQLESAVWGNTAAGGAVRISIRPVTKIALAVYDKEATKAQNALPQPQDRKTTPGLWYFSFGMDDMRREDSRRYRFQRHFVVPGARWELCLTARASRYQATDAKGKVLHEVPLNDPQMLLQQAQAALWLLCAYGGVGSKSRKGYGCFATPAELASLDRQQCSGWAAEFRRACGVKEGAPCGSPHLEDMLLEEISTPWTNYWFVLDRIGAAAQDFAKLYKHSVMKKALGLPRRIGTPMRDAFTPGPHAAKTDRHASPVMYHVVRQKDGTYTVRMTAFPSPELPLDPTRKASRSFLEKLFTHVKKLMDGWTKNAEYSKIGKKPPQVPTSSRPSTSSTAPAPVQRAAPSLRVGDIVQVVIVPDPRGKGRLFGRHEPTGLVGPIQNAERLPKRPEIGETLPVVVASVSATGKDVQFKVLEQPQK